MIGVDEASKLLTHTAEKGEFCVLRWEQAKEIKALLQRQKQVHKKLLATSETVVGHEPMSCSCKGNQRM
jgi:hypothetical protein